MGDQDKEGRGSIPSWQQAASNTTDSTPATLEQARTFLLDESVRESSREKKFEFLKSKGLGEADINTLLAETDAPAAATTMTTTTTTTTATTGDTHNAARAESRSTPVYDAPRSLTTSETKTDQPPIITYPEFLTKPAKPPPLITAFGLLNALGIVAGLSTFVYGATKYIVSPMVDSLTDSRVELHENANKNLSQLVEKLENAVSEIPESYHIVGKKSALANNGHGVPEYTDAGDDDASSYDDPTELFHRDIGVQTSPPPTPGGLSYQTAGTAAGESADKKHSSAVATQQQADKLGRLITSIRDLSTDLASQADGFGETKNVLDDFGRDLHALTYPPESFGVGSGYLYGTARNEPEDEIKKVKSNIRSVKGVLLSTRSFAAPTR